MINCFVFNIFLPEGSTMHIYTSYTLSPQNITNTANVVRKRIKPFTNNIRKYLSLNATGIRSMSPINQLYRQVLWKNLKNGHKLGSDFGSGFHVVKRSVVSNLSEQDYHQFRKNFGATPFIAPSTHLKLLAKQPTEDKTIDDQFQPPVVVPMVALHTPAEEQVETVTLHTPAEEQDGTVALHTPAEEQVNDLGDTDTVTLHASAEEQVNDRGDTETVSLRTPAKEQVNNRGDKNVMKLTDVSRETSSAHEGLMVNGSYSNLGYPALNIFTDKKLLEQYLKLKDQLIPKRKNIESKNKNSITPINGQQKHILIAKASSASSVDHFAKDFNSQQVPHFYQSSDVSSVRSPNSAVTRSSIAQQERFPPSSVSTVVSNSAAVAETSPHSIHRFASSTAFRSLNGQKSATGNHISNEVKRLSILRSSNEDEPQSLRLGTMVTTGNDAASTEVTGIGNITTIVNGELGSAYEPSLESLKTGTDLIQAESIIANDIGRNVSIETTLAETAADNDNKTISDVNVETEKTYIDPPIVYQYRQPSLLEIIQRLPTFILHVSAVLLAAAKG